MATAEIDVTKLQALYELTNPENTEALPKDLIELKNMPGSE